MIEQKNEKKKKLYTQYHKIKKQKQKQKQNI